VQSCLYEGRVSHRRFSPKPHAFAYSVFYVYLDLDELEQVFARRWFWSTRRPAPAWFRRTDHLGPPHRPLKQAVADVVERHTGERPSGPIRLLTQLRHFGYVFNPVSLYYCFDETGTHLETIVAEVNNTPWGEQHLYVLPQQGAGGHTGHSRFRLDKEFHVSPFMPMDMHYDWVVTVPGQHLSVRMTNYRANDKVLDATLALERKPVDGIHCALTLLRHPCMTLKIVGAIYWQALKLLLKGVPTYTHPAKLDHSPAGANTTRAS
jgi:DUF1365 family protein